MPTADTALTKPLSPSTLNQQVRGLLERTWSRVWIEGELSNLARPGSGHLYFSLKDTVTQVRCAMFRTHARTLRFKPADGMQVLLRARVSLYEARGEFQLLVEHMALAGAGVLQREFEQLKTRLHAEGLFDATRKRPIPRYARNIGILTSSNGAAVYDVINVLTRRWPLTQVELLPIPVQGREAPPMIVSMLNKASRCGRYDVILLTRGGGSLEDLMAFNDETLARTIHASSVPVVSAIGHEIDFSIADFVADLRAPTPSAAAELLVPDQDAIKQQLRDAWQRLDMLQQRSLQNLGQRLDHGWRRLQVQRPQVHLARKRERLTQCYRHLRDLLHRTHHQQQTRLSVLHARLRAHAPRHQLKQWQRNLDEQYRRLHSATIQRLEQDRRKIQQTARALHAVSPLKTLDRGYAILFDEHDQVLRSNKQIKPGMAVHARLADGEFNLHVDGNLKPSRSR